MCTFSACPPAVTRLPFDCVVPIPCIISVRCVLCGYPMRERAERTTKNTFLLLPSIYPLTTKHKYSAKKHLMYKYAAIPLENTYKIIIL